MKFLKKNITFIICFIVAILIVLGFFKIILSNSSAKYTNNSKWNHSISTDSFYFTSSLLSEIIKENIINYYNYEDIELDIKNGFDENTFTKAQINYELSCSAPTGVICKIDSSNDSTISSTFENDNTFKTNNHVLHITRTSGNDLTIPITVTATTSVPYVKTISATFILNTIDLSNVITKKVSTSSDKICEYDITNNGGVVKNIKVSIDTNKYVFDENSESFKNKSNYDTINNKYSSIYTSISAFKVIRITLYKKTSSTCNVNDITIT